MTVSPPSSFLTGKYINRKHRQSAVEFFSSLLESEVVDEKDQGQMRIYIDLLKKPTTEVNHITIADRKELDKLIEKYNITDQQPCETTYLPPRVQSEDSEEKINVPLTLTQRQLFVLANLLDSLATDQGELSFLREVSDLLAEYTQKHKSEGKEMKVSELLNIVEETIENIPNRSTWERIFAADIGKDRIPLHGDNALRVFYEHTKKLTSKLESKSYCSTDAIEMREIETWMLRNVPELEGQDDEDSEWEHKPEHLISS